MEPLDVDLGPNFKFVVILVGVFTCGVGAIAMYLTALSWPKQLTEEGITTRGGKTVRWEDLDQQTRVTAVDHLGRRMAGRLDLKFGRTTVKIVPQSIVQGPQVMEFLSEVLGRDARTG